jgi:hypothetical protein
VPGSHDKAVFPAGKLVRIAFAGDDRAENRHAGSTTNVTDYISELHIHLGQRFLHVLYAFASRSHEALSSSQVGSQNPNLRRGTERIINNPNVCSFCNHWHSSTSVFRPGGVFVCLAFTTLTWNPWSSRI